MEYITYWMENYSLQLLAIYKTQTGVDLVPDPEPVPWSDLLKEIQYVLTAITSTNNTRDWQMFLEQQTSLSDGIKQWVSVEKVHATYMLVHIHKWKLLLFITSSLFIELWTGWGSLNRSSTWILTNSFMLFTPSVNYSISLWSESEVQYHLPRSILIHLE